MFVLQMALSLWNATGNVQTWFHRLSMREGEFTTSYEDLGDFDTEFGIQKRLATKICEFIFDNDIALLTVEIAQPRILELVKDIKVTFPDMLGTIGKRIIELRHELITLNFRRDDWPLHWHKLDKHFRAGLLGVQDSGEIFQQQYVKRQPPTCNMSGIVKFQ